MNYLDALRLVHDAVKPGFYLEIGCRKGDSLELAQCPRLAIDPAPEITTGLSWPTRIFRESSDSFFERPDVRSLLGQPPDLAFIDGMHLVEYALRDFINVEDQATPDTVIMIDDVVPGDIAWASRERETQAWTGDVYRLIPLLRHYRPDLQIDVFDATILEFGKGLAVIRNPAPGNTVLRDAYDKIMADLEAGAYCAPDTETIRTQLQVRPAEDFPEFATGMNRPRPQPATTDPYLDLLKRSLLNEIYLDDELRLLYLRDCLAGEETFDYPTYHDIRNARRDLYRDLQATREIGRFPGRDIHKSGFNHSMMGRKRLDSLHHCLDHVRTNDIPGDFMECGVWRGGGCIFMAGYARAHGMDGRRVLVADSFEGLPKPSHDMDAKLDLSKDLFPELAVSQETVAENFSLYGLLDDTVLFLKGWFRDTLPKAPVDQIAVLRLDGDLYESTMDALTALYDKVSEGGVVIIDDFGAIQVCEQAVRDFFEQRGEPFPRIETIDWTGAYWIKQSPARVPAPKIRSFDTPFSQEVMQALQKGVMGYRYKGTPCLKSPLDMSIYLKLLWDLKPRTIIEIGSKHGGSALFFADIAQLFGLEAHVYSIDLTQPALTDPRITFLQGDVNHLDKTFAEHGLSACPHPWYVNEDSAHTYQGCLAALKVLAAEMQPGDMLSMEDGVLDELGLSENYDGGPNRAIAEFFETHPDTFELVTELCDMFGQNATYNPNGYLRKT